MSVKLFSSLQIGSVTVPNRIAIAPMCQYSAADGTVNEWHLQHWMNMAMSGSGLVMVEATGVERIGRITHGCIGLYNDLNEREMKRVLDSAKAVALPGTKFGVQLGHAGRKASSMVPWRARKRMMRGRLFHQARFRSHRVGRSRRCLMIKGSRGLLRHSRMRPCAHYGLALKCSKFI